MHGVTRALLNCSQSPVGGVHDFLPITIAMFRRAENVTLHSVVKNPAKISGKEVIKIWQKLDKKLISEIA
jgi:hypothetical protein